MKIIGLTGSIASGKNFVAEVFAKYNAAIFDADKEVHELFESDKLTFSEILKNFPTAIINQKINRKILGEIVFVDEKKLQILEKIIHPKIQKKSLEFIERSKKNNVEIAILNIPLLLEKQGYKCDKIISVIAPKSLQKKRFLARVKKNNPENFKKELKNFEKKFEEIYSRQLNNNDRKKKSDFVVNNAISRADTEAQVKKIIAKIAA